MIEAFVEDQAPALVVPGAGDVYVDVSVGRHFTHHTIKDAGIITLPFLSKSVFRGTDISVIRRVEMERNLLRTGLFSKVVLSPGAPGWLPIRFVLTYSGKEHEGWLYYPNPYEGGDA